MNPRKRDIDGRLLEDFIDAMDELSTDELETDASGACYSDADPGL